MTIVRTVRNLLKTSLLLRKFVAYKLAPSGFFDSYFRNYIVDDGWRKRIETVKMSSDNKRLVKVSEAGKIEAGKQIMHNGIKVNLGSYYGPEVAVMLLENNGIHEPQEEFAFSEVLKYIPQGGVMIEMGCFWAFYSLWFNKEIVNAKNYLIEPDKFNITSGKENFKLNNIQGRFFNYFIEGQSGSVDGVRQVTVEEFVDENAIDFIDILHSDIQGYELGMLKGASELLKTARIGYLFISTHSNELHYKCMDFLAEFEYTIVCDCDLDDSYSLDGLIVAKSNKYPGPTKLTISQRTKD